MGFFGGIHFLRYPFLVGELTDDSRLLFNLSPSAYFHDKSTVHYITCCSIAINLIQNHLPQSNNKENIYCQNSMSNVNDPVVKHGLPLTLEYGYH